MAVETGDDLAGLFDTDDFGAEALYNGAELVVGILRSEYVELADVEGYSPVFTCRAADVDGVAHGDALDIDGTTYTVRGVQPDGTGVVRLILEG